MAKNFKAPVVWVNDRWVGRETERKADEIGDIQLRLGDGIGRIQPRFTDPQTLPESKLYLQIHR
jgi:hypothetical protein